jgi:hypothetical protein
MDSITNNLKKNVGGLMSEIKIFEISVVAGVGQYKTIASNKTNRIIYKNKHYYLEKLKKTKWEIVGGYPYNAVHTIVFLQNETLKAFCNLDGVKI